MNDERVVEVNSEGTAVVRPRIDGVDQLTDQRRAELFAEGMASSGVPLAPDAVAMLEEALGVARAGGDVAAFLREQRRRP